MIQNLFDLKAQYSDLYETLGYDKMDISENQDETMYMMFMTGARLMLEMLTTGVGNMDEPEAMETIKSLFDQLDGILNGG